MSISFRVIKNTAYLYIKMGITMFVSLYSTRLILASLGEADFGIFNVVGGAIAMLGFLNSTLANATQRFMSYAEGEGCLEKKRTIFNVSMVLHHGIAIITALFLLSMMHPLFNNVFNIEQERIFAAKVVYLSLVFSSLLTIINVPYDAVMNAHENMLYYSVVGIFESMLRLGVAFICVNSTIDRLILYGVLMACIPLITLSIMKVYCHKHYEECVVAPLRYWDVSTVRQIRNFFGWNFLTALSSLFSAQGIGIVLNHFFGAALNAAQGIANQVNGALSQFSGNMMKALNPVIVKSAGSHNYNAMNRASLIGCKYSSLLTIFFAVPLTLEIHYVLHLWLEVVPEWTSLFCMMQLAMSIITQMANSASTAVYAQGGIKEYAIWKSVMNALPVILVWISFMFGGSPVWLYLPMIVVWAIGGDCVIVYYAKKNCGLSVNDYLMKVVLPIGVVVIIMFLLGLLPVMFFTESFIRLIITCVLTTAGMGFTCLLFAFTKEEKALFLGLIKRLIRYR